MQQPIAQERTAVDVHRSDGQGLLKVAFGVSKLLECDFFVHIVGPAKMSEDVCGARILTGGSRQAGFEYTFELCQLGGGDLFRLLSLGRKHMKILQPAHRGINLPVLRGLTARVELQNLLIGLESRLVLSLFRLRSCCMKQLVDAQLTVMRHAPRSQAYASRRDYR